MNDLEQLGDILRAGDIETTLTEDLFGTPVLVAFLSGRQINILHEQDLFSWQDTQPGDEAVDGVTASIWEAAFKIAEEVAA